MGYRTAVVTAVGADDNGAIIVNQLRKQGISIRHLQTIKSAPTGYSVIILSGSGERTVLVHRGAAGRLSPAAVAMKELNAKWFYLSSLGGNLAMVRKITARAAKTGAKVAWNPGGKEIAKGFRVLAPLIRKTDVLILNREEAALLAGRDPKNLEAIVRHLGDHPRKALIITDGKNGAYAFGKDVRYHCPSLTKKRINTTGAGDAFGSGFIAGLLKKDDLRYALGVAACNAAGVISHMGAKKGIMKACPLPSRVEKMMIRTWK
jgi:ribokinase